MDGFILINKEKNMTSYDVVRVAKKKLQTKKIGHTGTLDPDTSGLVVLGVGKATKAIPLITEGSKKEYIATCQLGEKKDTADHMGETIETKSIESFSKEELEAVLKSFLGKSNQIPPIYSAKKVNGKKLYEYARNNESVEIKAQEIEIFEIELLDCEEDNFTFRSVVSKGTYIRSLIEDVCEKTNNIGYMDGLTRTNTDGFYLKDAKEVSEVTCKDIIPLENILRDKYEVYEVYGSILNLIKNGSKIQKKDNISYPCLYVDKETQKMIAVYDVHKDETKPILML